jgi:hypothetical protein
MSAPAPRIKVSLDNAQTWHEARIDRHRGLPYPGLLLLDAQGRVMQKRFQQSYRERETGAGILAQGFGPTSSVHGLEAHGQPEGVKVRASLDSET